MHIYVSDMACSQYTWSAYQVLREAQENDHSRPLRDVHADQCCVASAHDHVGLPVGGLGLQADTFYVVPLFARRWTWVTRGVTRRRPNLSKASTMCRSSGQTYDSENKVCRVSRRLRRTLTEVGSDDSSTEDIATAGRDNYGWCVGHIVFAYARKLIEPDF